VLPRLLSTDLCRPKIGRGAHAMARGAGLRRIGRPALGFCDHSVWHTPEPSRRNIMGMDVYGKSPKDETGEYFWRSVWGWHPLADLVTTLCPKQAAPCQYWHSNDGDGLNAMQAVALADALADLVARGQVRAYVAIREAEIERMPDEPCDMCSGNGIRCDAVGKEMKQPQKAIAADATWRNRKHPRAGQVGWCNGCDGRGVNRPWADACHVDENAVIEFIAFLRRSGGFTIW
jgi:hypothetical protein